MDDLKQKSWFSRNWGWLLGGGCLSLIAIVVLVVVGAFYKISDSIQESEPYSHAFSLATENENVIAFLGEPIESNGIGSTNYKYVNGSTNASLTIPIKGPNNESEIIVEAEQINNEWSYSKLYVKIDGENKVIYLQENTAVLDEEDNNEDYEEDEEDNDLE